MVILFCLLALIIPPGIGLAIARAKRRAAERLTAETQPDFPLDDTDLDDAGDEAAPQPMRLGPAIIITLRGPKPTATDYRIRDAIIATMQREGFRLMFDTQPGYIEHGALIKHGLTVPYLGTSAEDFDTFLDAHEDQLFEGAQRQEPHALANTLPKADHAVTYTHASGGPPHEPPVE